MHLGPGSAALRLVRLGHLMAFSMSFQKSCCSCSMVRPSLGRSCPSANQPGAKSAADNPEPNSTVLVLTIRSLAWLHCCAVNIDVHPEVQAEEVETKPFWVQCAPRNSSDMSQSWASAAWTGHPIANASPPQKLETNRADNNCQLSSTVGLTLRGRTLIILKCRAIGKYDIFRSQNQDTDVTHGENSFWTMFREYPDTL